MVRQGRQMPQAPGPRERLKKSFFVLRGRYHQVLKYAHG